MRGKRQVADCNSSDKEDISLGERQHILLDLGRSGLSFLAFGFLQAEDFIDRGHDMAKDVILGDDVGEGSRAIQDDKLMQVLIIPDNLIDPVCYEIQVMVRLSGGEEEINLSILVLQDDLCSILVGEDSQDWVVGLMLHYHVLIFDVVILQPRGVIQINEEDLCNEELDDLSVSFNREHFLLRLLILDLNQVELVLVVQESSPSVANLDPLYRVLALDLVHFLPSGNQHLVSEPAVKLHSISEASCQMAGAKRDAGGLERQVDIVDELSFLLGGAAEQHDFAERAKHGNELIVSADEHSRR